MRCKGTNCNKSDLDRCTGGWCTATIVEDKASNTKTIERACTQVPPTNSGKFNCTVELNGAITIKRCVCNDVTYCNGLDHLSAMLNEDFFESKY